jgi:outer membrane receptor for ferrienterochelin and colicins
MSIYCCSATKNLLLTLFLSASMFAVSQETDDFLTNLSLEDLLNIEITTASNVKEKLSDAPAVVLVFTQEEITNRGYNDLVELFDDLPGIDTAITYGDLYFRPYWRGFRKGTSSAFLFMVDGMVMNHLWFNWTDIMVAMPLTNIDQVEVVYGPASSVYGANALMGVINIITKKTTEGSDFNLRLSAGSFNTRVADMTYLHQGKDYVVRFTASVSQGDLDEDSLRNYTWTNPDLLQDRRLWGGFLDNDSVAGKVTSPRKNKSLSFAGFIGGTEVGVQYYYVGDMYGTNYAFDRMQTQAVWVEEDINAYFKHNRQLNNNVRSNTVMRYRESDVPNKSNSVEGYPSGDGSRVVTFGFWQSLSSSWSIEQSFDIRLDDRWSFKTGLKFEEKDLQKAYDLPYGPELAPEDVDAATYPYPLPPGASTIINNRAVWRDEGLYVQAKYLLNHWIDNGQDHFLNLGVRRDKNSYYGGHTTLRAGYVGHYGNFSTKVLYGEAIQEPTPRQLYGGWGGSGSSPDLSPELSKTLEFYVGYTKDNYSIAINPYYNNIEDTIFNLTDGPTNNGVRDIYGFDIHSHLLTSIADNELKFWAYYSYLDTTEETLDSEGISTGNREIGDMSDHKIHFGVTGQFLNNRLYATVRGRYYSDRNTIETNPVNTVDSYFTLDANFRYRDFLVNGLELSLRVNNLTDEQYFHPGIRDASSGNTPGFFDDDGNWQGSAGWSNSLLPQPGRSVILSLHIRL